jgi:hypothetical protein
MELVQLVITSPNVHLAKPFIERLACMGEASGEALPCLINEKNLTLAISAALR